MLVTTEQFEKFSGTYKDSDEVSASLVEIYIGTASEIIENYLGYDPETADRFKNDDDTYTIPDSIKMVCLEIATLLQLEEKNNIGVNSKSFGDSGSRAFLNVVDYSKYLKRISKWRDVPDG